jgi:hypothetical protein
LFALFTVTSPVRVFADSAVAVGNDYRRRIRTSPSTVIPISNLEWTSRLPWGGSPSKMSAESPWWCCAAEDGFADRRPRHPGSLSPRAPPREPRVLAPPRHRSSIGSTGRRLGGRAEDWSSWVLPGVLGGTALISLQQTSGGRSSPAALLARLGLLAGVVGAVVMGPREILETLDPNASRIEQSGRRRGPAHRRLSRSLSRSWRVRSDEVAHGEVYSRVETPDLMAPGLVGGAIAYVLFLAGSPPMMTRDDHELVQKTVAQRAIVPTAAVAPPAMQPPPLQPPPPVPRSVVVAVAPQITPIQDRILSEAAAIGEWKLACVAGHTQGVRYHSWGPPRPMHIPMHTTCGPM